MSSVALAALEQPKKHSPLPNSYWVVPGRLAGGEHPAAVTLSDMTDRLQQLLFAGITMFIDLTEEGEGTGYEHLLVYATGAVPLKYTRFEIREGGVPATRNEMTEILESIDTHLAQGGTVYVHGKLGVGRPATVIGCYLVNLGLSTDEALDRLNEVWLESERSQNNPQVPKTKLQIDYIRHWQPGDIKALSTQSLVIVPQPSSTQNLQPRSEPAVVPVVSQVAAPASTTAPTVKSPVTSPVASQSASTASSPAPSMEKLDRFSGALLGMAIGEALGAQLWMEPQETPASASAPTVMSEHQVKDLLEGGPHKLPRGAWLSDTAMCWCLAESYLACGGRPEDQLQRYLDWQNNGNNTSTGAAVHVPSDVTKALSLWQRSNKALLVSKESTSHDAHALARTTAAVLAFSNKVDQALVEVTTAGRTTTNATMALDANRVFAMLLFDALHDVEKETMLSLKRSDSAKRLRQSKFKYPVLQIMDGWWRGPIAPARTGQDSLAVLQTALWAFERTSNFRDAVVTAVNSCRNASSSGAVCGALAGAYYGMQAIPQEWRSTVLRGSELSDLGYRLASR